jgi:hypothetical protein
MGIRAKELRLNVIRPTLRYLDMWSNANENLLLGTAAVESSLGFHLKAEQHQYLGIYQISPKKHKLIWDHYLFSLPKMASLVRGLASQREFIANPHKELATNLSYATSVAWSIYHSCGISIKDDYTHDVQYLAKIWHKNFNKSNKTINYFCSQYSEYVLEEVPNT